jgi:tetratricopeptide (TPR) repeat protein
MMNYSKIEVTKTDEMKNITVQFKENVQEYLANINDLEFQLPADADTYVRTLLIVCLIELGYKKEQNLVSVMYDHDVESCSAQFHLLANTYYAKKDYFQAKYYFHLLLTNVREYLIQLDIWLKYGNCCNYLNEIDDAINAYRNAVNLDSSNTEAALSLVNVLKNNKELFDEASNVIRASNVSSLFYSHIFH